ncbi:MAG: T9SS type A sorting domain-containing protein [Winogradskyella sp.]|uniref:T9SS type A sorting domain-containing protein n=1 Tax=Winogradskyella sp. TaxID=1883156 RepID=UPI00385809EC
MKKITFLMILLISSLGYAQVTVVQDFEAGGIDGGFGNGVSAGIVADPASGGTNGMVAQIIAGAGGNIWQGANVTLSEPVDLTQASPSDRTMEIDVYSDSTTPISMLVRVIGTVNNEASAVVTHPGGGVWATLTATFDTSLEGKPIADGIYTAFVVFPNWDTTTSNFIDPAIARTVFFDNVAGIPATVAPDPEPATAAPSQPARSPENVRSIFSSAYTDIAVDTFDTTWCPATTTEVMIEGVPTKKITGLGCEGVEFITGRFDATGFGFFHMDIWTDSDTMDKSFNFKFSDWQGGAAEAGALEYSATNANILPATNPGTWISIDLPLSAFTTINGVDGSDLVQFVITSDLGTVYYDNLYLHNNNLSTDDFATTNFKVYPNPTRNNWNIESNSTITSVSVFDVLGKRVSALTPNANNVEISTANIKSGIYFARIEGVNGSKTVKLIKE